MQRGGGSKDTWVLERRPGQPASACCRRRRAPIALSRGGSDLPSRAADNLYWLGRYAERAEGVARLGRVHRRRASPSRSPVDGGPSSRAELGRAGRAPLAAQASLQLAAVAGARRRTAARWPIWEAAVCSALLDPTPAGGLAGDAARRCSAWPRKCRDRLSTDTWRVLHGARPGDGGEARHWGERDRRTTAGRAAGAARPRGAVLAALQRAGRRQHDPRPGLAVPRHGPPARARLATLTLLLRARLAAPVRSRGPAAGGGARDRRQRHDLPPPLPQPPQAAPVLDLLLADEANPRSVIFQLDAWPSTSTGCRATAPSPCARTEQRLVARAARRAAAGRRSRRWPPPTRTAPAPSWRRCCERWSDDLPVLSDSLSASYLSHAARLAAARRCGGGDTVKLPGPPPHRVHTTPSRSSLSHHWCT